MDTVSCTTLEGILHGHTVFLSNFDVGVYGNALYHSITFLFVAQERKQKRRVFTS